MERLLIKNIRYLYCMDEEDTFLENADIYIEGNVIKKIGTKLDVPADGVKVVDGTGKLALPGFLSEYYQKYSNHAEGKSFGLASLLIWSMGKYGRRGCKGGSPSGDSRASNDWMYHFYGLYVFLPPWKT